MSWNVEIMNNQQTSPHSSTEAGGATADVRIRISAGSPMDGQLNNVSIRTYISQNFDANDWSTWDELAYGNARYVYGLPRFQQNQFLNPSSHDDGGVDYSEDTILIPDQYVANNMAIKIKVEIYAGNSLEMSDEQQYDGYHYNTAQLEVTGISHSAASGSGSNQTFKPLIYDSTEDIVLDGGGFYFNYHWTSGDNEGQPVPWAISNDDSIGYCLRSSCGDSRTFSWTSMQQFGATDWAREGPFFIKFNETLSSYPQNEVLSESVTEFKIALGHQKWVFNSADFQMVDHVEINSYEVEPYALEIGNNFTAIRNSSVPGAVRFFTSFSDIDTFPGNYLNYLNLNAGATFNDEFSVYSMEETSQDNIEVTILGTLYDLIGTNIFFKPKYKWQAENFDGNTITDSESMPMWYIAPQYYFADDLQPILEFNHEITNESENLNNYGVDDVTRLPAWYPSHDMYLWCAEDLTGNFDVDNEDSYVFSLWYKEDGSDDDWQEYSDSELVIATGYTGDNILTVRGIDSINADGFVGKKFWWQIVGTDQTLNTPTPLKSVEDLNSYGITYPIYHSPPELSINITRNELGEIDATAVDPGGRDTGSGNIENNYEYGFKVGSLGEDTVLPVFQSSNEFYNHATAESGNTLQNAFLVTKWENGSSGIGDDLTSYPYGLNNTLSVSTKSFYTAVRPDQVRVTTQFSEDNDIHNLQVTIENIIDSGGNTTTNFNEVEFIVSVNYTGSLDPISASDEDDDGVVTLDFDLVDAEYNEAIGINITAKDLDGATTSIHNITKHTLSAPLLQTVDNLTADNVTLNYTDRNINTHYYIIQRADINENDGTYPSVSSPVFDISTWNEYDSSSDGLDAPSSSGKRSTKFLIWSANADQVINPSPHEFIQVFLPENLTSGNMSGSSFNSDGSSYISMIDSGGVQDTNYIDSSSYMGDSNNLEPFVVEKHKYNFSENTYTLLDEISRDFPEEQDSNGYLSYFNDSEGDEFNSYTETLVEASGTEFTPYLDNKLGLPFKLKYYKKYNTTDGSELNSENKYEIQCFNLFKNFIEPTEDLVVNYELIKTLIADDSNLFLVYKAPLNYNLNWFNRTLYKKGSIELDETTEAPSNFPENGQLVLDWPDLSNTNDFIQIRFTADDAEGDSAPTNDNWESPSYFWIQWDPINTANNNAVLAFAASLTEGDNLYYTDIAGENNNFDFLDKEIPILNTPALSPEAVTGGVQLGPWEVDLTRESVADADWQREGYITRNPRYSSIEHTLDNSTIGNPKHKISSLQAPNPYSGFGDIVWFTDEDVASLGIVRDTDENGIHLDTYFGFTRKFTVETRVGLNLVWDQLSTEDSNLYSGPGGITDGFSLVYSSLSTDPNWNNVKQGISISSVEAVGEDTLMIYYKNMMHASHVQKLVFNQYKIASECDVEIQNTSIELDYSNSSNILPDLSLYQIAPGDKVLIDGVPQATVQLVAYDGTTINLTVAEDLGTLTNLNNTVVKITHGDDYKIDLTSQHASDSTFTLGSEQHLQTTGYILDYDNFGVASDDVSLSIPGVPPGQSFVIEVETHYYNDLTTHGPIATETSSFTTISDQVFSHLGSPEEISIIQPEQWTYYKATFQTSYDFSFEIKIDGGDPILLDSYYVNKNGTWVEILISSQVHYNPSASSHIFNMRIKNEATGIVSAWSEDIVVNSPGIGSPILNNVTPTINSLDYDVISPSTSIGTNQALVAIAKGAPDVSEHFGYKKINIDNVTGKELPVDSSLIIGVGSTGATDLGAGVQGYGVCTAAQNDSGTITYNTQAACEADGYSWISEPDWIIYTVEFGRDMFTEYIGKNLIISSDEVNSGSFQDIKDLAIPIIGHDDVQNVIYLAPGYIPANYSGEVFNNNTSLKVGVDSKSNYKVTNLLSSMNYNVYSHPYLFLGTTTSSTTTTYSANDFDLGTMDPWSVDTNSFQGDINDLNPIDGSTNINNTWAPLVIEDNGKKIKATLGTDVCSINASSPTLRGPVVKATGHTTLEVDFNAKVQTPAQWSPLSGVYVNVYLEVYNQFCCETTDINGDNKNYYDWSTNNPNTTASCSENTGWAADYPAVQHSNNKENVIYSFQLPDNLDTNQGANPINISPENPIEVTSYYDSVSGKYKTIQEGDYYNLVFVFYDYEGNGTTDYHIELLLEDLQVTSNVRSDVIEEFSKAEFASTFANSWTLPRLAEIILDDSSNESHLSFTHSYLNPSGNEEFSTFFLAEGSINFDTFEEGYCVEDSQYTTQDSCNDATYTWSQFRSPLSLHSQSSDLYSDQAYLNEGFEDPVNQGILFSNNYKYSATSRTEEVDLNHGSNSGYSWWYPEGWNYPDTGLIYTDFMLTSLGNRKIKAYTITRSSLNYNNFSIASEIYTMPPISPDALTFESPTELEKLSLTLIDSKNHPRTNYKIKFGDQWIGDFPVGGDYELVSSEADAVSNNVAGWENKVVKDLEYNHRYKFEAKALAEDATHSDVYSSPFYKFTLASPFGNPTVDASTITSNSFTVEFDALIDDTLRTSQLLSNAQADINTSEWNISNGSIMPVKGVYEQHTNLGNNTNSSDKGAVLAFTSSGGKAETTVDISGHDGDINGYVYIRNTTGYDELKISLVRIDNTNTSQIEEHNFQFTEDEVTDEHGTYPVLTDYNGSTLPATADSASGEWVRLELTSPAMNNSDNLIIQIETNAVPHNFEVSNIFLEEASTASPFYTTTNPTLTFRKLVAFSSDTPSPDSGTYHIIESPYIGPMVNSHTFTGLAPGEKYNIILCAMNGEHFNDNISLVENGQLADIVSNLSPSINTGGPEVQIPIGDVSPPEFKDATGAVWPYQGLPFKTIPMLFVNQNINGETYNDEVEFSIFDQTINKYLNKTAPSYGMSREWIDNPSYAAYEEWYSESIEDRVGIPSVVHYPASNYTALDPIDGQAVVIPTTLGDYGNVVEFGSIDVNQGLLSGPNHTYNHNGSDYYYQDTQAYSALLSDGGLNDAVFIVSEEDLFNSLTESYMSKIKKGTLTMCFQLVANTNQASYFDAQLENFFDPNSTAPIKLWTKINTSGPSFITFTDSITNGTYGNATVNGIVSHSPADYIPPHEVVTGDSEYPNAAYALIYDPNNDGSNVDSKYYLTDTLGLWYSEEQSCSDSQYTNKITCESANKKWGFKFKFVDIVNPSSPNIHLAYEQDGVCDADPSKNRWECNVIGGQNGSDGWTPDWSAGDALASHPFSFWFYNGLGNPPSNIGVPNNPFQPWSGNFLGRNISFSGVFEYEDASIAHTQLNYEGHDVLNNTSHSLKILARTDVTDTIGTSSSVEQSSTLPSSNLNFYPSYVINGSYTDTDKLKIPAFVDTINNISDIEYRLKVYEYTVDGNLNSTVHDQTFDPTQDYTVTGLTSGTYYEVELGVRNSVLGGDYHTSKKEFATLPDIAAGSLTQLAPNIVNQAGFTSIGNIPYHKINESGWKCCLKINNLNAEYESSSYTSRSYYLGLETWNDSIGTYFTNLTDIETYNFNNNQYGQSQTSVIPVYLDMEDESFEDTFSLVSTDSSWYYGNCEIEYSWVVTWDNEDGNGTQTYETSPSSYITNPIVPEPVNVLPDLGTCATEGFCVQEASLLTSTDCINAGWDWQTTGEMVDNTHLTSKALTRLSPTASLSHLETVEESDKNKKKIVYQIGDSARVDNGELIIYLGSESDSISSIEDLKLILDTGSETLELTSNSFSQDFCDANDSAVILYDLYGKDHTQWTGDRENLDNIGYIKLIDAKVYFGGMLQLDQYETITVEYTSKHNDCPYGSTFTKTKDTFVGRNATGGYFNVELLPNKNNPSTEYKLEVWEHSENGAIAYDEIGVGGWSTNTSFLVNGEFGAGLSSNLEAYYFKLRSRNSDLDESVEKTGKWYTMLQQPSLELEQALTSSLKVTGTHNDPFTVYNTAGLVNEAGFEILPFVEETHKLLISPSLEGISATPTGVEVLLPSSKELSTSLGVNADHTISFSYRYHTNPEMIDFNTVNPISFFIHAEEDNSNNYPQVNKHTHGYMPMQVYSTSSSPGALTLDLKFAWENYSLLHDPSSGNIDSYLVDPLNELNLYNYVIYYTNADGDTEYYNKNTQAFDIISEAAAIPNSGPSDYLLSSTEFTVGSISQFENINYQVLHLTISGLIPGKDYSSLEFKGVNANREINAFYNHEFNLSNSINDFANDIHQNASNGPYAGQSGELNLESCLVPTIVSDKYQGLVFGYNSGGYNWDKMPSRFQYTDGYIYETNSINSNTNHYPDDLLDNNYVINNELHLQGPVSGNVITTQIPKASIPTISIVETGTYHIKMTFNPGDASEENITYRIRIGDYNHLRHSFQYHTDQNFVEFNSNFPLEDSFYYPTKEWFGVQLKSNPAFTPVEESSIFAEQVALYRQGDLKTKEEWMPEGDPIIIGYLNPSSEYKITVEAINGTGLITESITEIVTTNSKTPGVTLSETDLLSNNVNIADTPSTEVSDINSISISEHYKFPKSINSDPIDQSDNRVARKAPLGGKRWDSDGDLFADGDIEFLKDIGDEIIVLDSNSLQPLAVQPSSYTYPDLEVLRPLNSCSDSVGGKIKLVESIDECMCTGFADGSTYDVSAGTCSGDNQTLTGNVWYGLENTFILNGTKFIKRFAYDTDLPISTLIGLDHFSLESASILEFNGFVHFVDDVVFTLSKIPKSIGNLEVAKVIDLETSLKDDNDFLELPSTIGSLFKSASHRDLTRWPQVGNSSNLTLHENTFKVKTKNVPNEFGEMWFIDYVTLNTSLTKLPDSIMLPNYTAGINYLELKSSTIKDISTLDFNKVCSAIESSLYSNTTRSYYGFKDGGNFSLIASDASMFTNIQNYENQLILDATDRVFILENRSSTLMDPVPRLPRDFGNAVNYQLEGDNTEHEIEFIGSSSQKTRDYPVTDLAKIEGETIISTDIVADFYFENRSHVTGGAEVNIDARTDLNDMTPTAGITLSSIPNVLGVYAVESVAPWSGKRIPDINKITLQNPFGDDLVMFHKDWTFDNTNNLPVEDIVHEYFIHDSDEGQMSAFKRGGSYNTYQAQYGDSGLGQPKVWLDDDDTLQIYAGFGNTGGTSDYLLFSGMQTNDDHILTISFNAGDTYSLTTPNYTKLINEGPEYTLTDSSGSDISFVYSGGATEFTPNATLEMVNLDESSTLTLTYNGWDNEHFVPRANSAFQNIMLGFYTRTERTPGDSYHMIRAKFKDETGDWNNDIVVSKGGNVQSVDPSSNIPILKVFGYPSWSTGDDTIDGHLQVVATKFTMEFPNWKDGNERKFYPSSVTELSWDINTDWKLAYDNLNLGVTFPQVIEYEWENTGQCLENNSIHSRSMCNGVGYTWTNTSINPVVVFFDELISLNNWTGIIQGNSKYYNEKLEPWGNFYPLDGLPCDPNAGAPGSFNYEGVCIEKGDPWKWSELCGLSYPITALTGIPVDETDEYPSTELGTFSENFDGNDFDVLFKQRQSINWKPAIFEGSNLKMLALPFNYIPMEIPDSINNLDLEILDLSHTSFDSLEVINPNTTNELWLNNSEIQVLPNIYTLGLTNVEAENLLALNNIPDVSGYTGSMTWSENNGSKAASIALEDGVCSEDYPNFVFSSWLLSNGCVGNLGFTLPSTIHTNTVQGMVDLDPDTDQTKLVATFEDGSQVEYPHNEWETIYLNTRTFKDDTNKWASIGQSPFDAKCLDWTNIYKNTGKNNTQIFEIVKLNNDSFSPKLTKPYTYSMQIQIPIISRGIITWSTGTNTASGTIASLNVSGDWDYDGGISTYDSNGFGNTNLYIHVINIGKSGNEVGWGDISEKVLMTKLVEPVNLNQGLNINQFTWGAAGGNHYLQLRLSYTEFPTSDDDFLSAVNDAGVKFYTGDVETGDDLNVNFYVVPPGGSGN